jgi:hypothetical protein
MPSKSTARRARRDLREGKSPTTAAGEFVHEEIEHVRSGKHGALDAPGDRDRPVEGAPRRRAVAAAEERPYDLEDTQIGGA